MKRVSLFVVSALLIGGSAAVVGATSLVAGPKLPVPESRPVSGIAEPMVVVPSAAGPVVSAAEPSTPRTSASDMPDSRSCLLPLAGGELEVTFRDAGREWIAGFELADGDEWSSVALSCDIAYGDAWHCHADLEGHARSLRAALGPDLCSAAYDAVSG